MPGCSTRLPGPACARWREHADRVISPEEERRRSRSSSGFVSKGPARPGGAAAARRSGSNAGTAAPPRLRRVLLVDPDGLRLECAGLRDAPPPAGSPLLPRPGLGRECRRGHRHLLLGGLGHDGAHRHRLLPGLRHDAVQCHRLLAPAGAVAVARSLRLPRHRGLHRHLHLRPLRAGLGGPHPLRQCPPDDLVVRGGAGGGQRDGALAPGAAPGPAQDQPRARLRGQDRAEGHHRDVPPLAGGSGNFRSRRCRPPGRAHAAARPPNALPFRRAAGDRRL